MDKPKKFLESRIFVENADIRFSCLCAGFELKKWRFERLAAHLADWLPEFATRHDNLPATIGNISEYRDLMEKAAERVYTTGKTKRRGEIGEILLHAICREFFGTFPTVSKVYYKTASNDVVKGFDLVHTRYRTTASEETLLSPLEVRILDMALS